MGMQSLSRGGWLTIDHMPSHQCAPQTEQLYRLMLLFSFLCNFFVALVFCINASSRLFSAETKSVIIRKNNFIALWCGRSYLFSEKLNSPLPILIAQRNHHHFFFTLILLPPFTSMQFTRNDYKTVFLSHFFLLFHPIHRFITCIRLSAWMEWIIYRDSLKENTYMERRAGKGEQMGKKRSNLMLYASHLCNCICGRKKIPWNY